jgi:hypothetical protein
MAFVGEIWYQYYQQKCNSDPSHGTLGVLHHMKKLRGLIPIERPPLVGEVSANFYG